LQEIMLFIIKPKRKINLISCAYCLLLKILMYFYCRAAVVLHLRMVL